MGPTSQVRGRNAHWRVAERIGGDSVGTATPLRLLQERRTHLRCRFALPIRAPRQHFDPRRCAKVGAMLFVQQSNELHLRGGSDLGFDPFEVDTDRSGSDSEPRSDFRGRECMTRQLGYLSFSRR